VEIAETHYASYGGVSVAYQVHGHGDVDIVLPGGPATHLDAVLEVPGVERFLELLSRFARVIRFDRRGTGLSDPVAGPPTLEQQADDLLAVMDAAGSERAALLGEGDGTRLCALMAATHPDRVQALVLWAAAARGSDVVTPEVRDTLLDIFEQSWGRGEMARVFAPSRAEDPSFVRAMARFERSAVTPSMARALLDLASRSNVADILPSIRVPTLVLHRFDDPLVPARLGREVADAIPTAQFVALEGADNMIFLGDSDAVVEEIEEFLTGQRVVRDPDRALLTVLFTDLVDSTSRAARVGDARWRELLLQHDRMLRRELARWRGREVKTTGDGFVATFDGPARAIRCAHAIRDAVSTLGLELRAGMHTGECELLGNDIGGLAVHIAARVTAVASAGEVLVSNTVKDLVVGSGLRFTERGTHELRGVPGEWRLFAA
jgi:pimeloyl-ACP methyl ester carboxylesterase/class 3 adenylate cyclase